MLSSLTPVSLRSHQLVTRSTGERRAKDALLKEKGAEVINQFFHLSFWLFLKQKQRFHHSQDLMLFPMMMMMMIEYIVL